VVKVDLTPRQVRFLKSVMHDYLEVTEDRSIARDARYVLKRLENALRDGRTLGQQVEHLNRRIAKVLRRAP
jgi:hypothetical protein